MNNEQSENRKFFFYPPLEMVQGEVAFWIAASEIPPRNDVGGQRFNFGASLQSTVSVIARNEAIQKIMNNTIAAKCCQSYIFSFQFSVFN